MALIQCGEESVLYTGDFKLRRGLSAEPCEPRKADILIMETTYGLPQYVFPPTQDVLKGIHRLCREALDKMKFLCPWLLARQEPGDFVRRCRRRIAAHAPWLSV